LFSWGKYDRDLKRAIASLKYQNQPEIGEILGRWLGESWLKSGYCQKYPHLIVIPVPLHQDRIKIRGYNQAELIARGFCQITRYSLKNNLVMRTKNTEAMFGLNLVQRQENIQKAFRVSQGYQQIKTSQQILIIDDIYTTGTTVRAIKKILDQVNLQTIGVATVSNSSSGDNMRSP
jgi:ComF family protein